MAPKQEIMKGKERSAQAAEEEASLVGKTGVLMEFGASASMHGIRSAIASRLPLLRAFWTLVFIVSVCCTLFCFYRIVDQYLRLETDVDIQFKYRDVELPAVTVCSMNPYIFSAFNEIPELKQLLEAYEKRLEEIGKQEMEEKEEESQMV